MLAEQHDREATGLFVRRSVLDLDECRGLSAGDLLIAWTGLKQLRSICLNGIPEVSDTLLAAIAQALPLTEVGFGQCPPIISPNTCSPCALARGCRLTVRGRLGGGNRR